MILILQDKVAKDAVNSQSENGLELSPPEYLSARPYGQLADRDRRCSIPTVRTAIHRTGTGVNASNSLQKKRLLRPQQFAAAGEAL